MQSILVALSFTALVTIVQAGQSGYGVPEESYQSQTYKHVYVYNTPDDEPEIQSRTIRVPGGDKHVNIIFVKAPSQSSHFETEVILPEQDEHKNLVYVLSKKAESSSTVNIRRPAAPRQQKPEVYFIKYGNQGGQTGNGGGSSSSFGSGGNGAVGVRTPSSSYGAF